MQGLEDMESRVISAAAFVEGGTQDACDDACSICLEAFCQSDPSTVTSCKHEFHLQCILEWCQRSSQCPMCWQSISLKDSTSQELFEAVERERSIRVNRSRNAILNHPALAEFGLQHLPIGASDAELEERIIQHLAAAAAMSRPHHIARREGHRGRSASQGRTQFLVFSSNPNTSSMDSVPAAADREVEPVPSSISTANLPVLHTSIEELPDQAPDITPGQADQVVTLPAGYAVTAANMPGLSNSQTSVGQSTVDNQDRAGPSDIQSFSDSFKSRLNSVSMRYKESITKSTRGWKERFFSRNSSMSDLGSEVRREVTAGIATVSRMMERLDTRDNTRAASGIHNMPGLGVPGTSNEKATDSHANTLPNEGNISASCTANSGPN